MAACAPPAAEARPWEGTSGPSTRALVAELFLSGRPNLPLPRSRARCPQIAAPHLVGTEGAYCCRATPSRRAVPAFLGNSSVGPALRTCGRGSAIAALEALHFLAAPSSGQNLVVSNGFAMSGPRGRMLAPRSLRSMSKVLPWDEDGEQDNKECKAGLRMSDVQLGAMSALALLGLGPELLLLLKSHAALLGGSGCAKTFAGLLAGACKTAGLTKGAPPLYTAASVDASDVARLMQERRRAIMVGLTLIWLTWGFVVLPHQYNLTFAQTLYSMQEVMLTLGIGDIWPHTDWQKVSFGCFCLFNILFISEAFIQMTGDGDEFDPKLKAAPQSDPGARPIAPIRATHHGLNALSATALAALFMAAGVVLNRMTNRCSCPRGVTHCVAAKCKELGGVPTNWADSFLGVAGFMGTIFNAKMIPETDWGRTLVVLWGVPAVAAMTLASVRVMQWLKEHETEHKGHIITEEEFEAIDQETNGQLDRVEFQRHMLTSLGLVHPEDLQLINDHFTAMDDNQEGIISTLDMRRYFGYQELGESV